MKKFILALLSVGIAASAAPAFADTASKPYRFTRDGETFVISSRVTAKGEKILTGYEEKSGREFTLRVARGHVNGDFGGTRVSYDVPAVAVAAASDD